MNLVILFVMVFQLAQCMAQLERVDTWFEKSLKDSDISLRVEDKKNLLRQLKLVITLRRQMAKKYREEMSRKMERLQKEKKEREQSIYRKYLLSRIRSSVLNDFHTLRY
jgi:hypothetical protein